MQVPLSLLQTYFSSPLSTKEILEACDHIGIEADVHITTPLSCTSIITARIVQTAPHPNANKLLVAILTDGKQEYQIVCGASNCRAGLIVPLALPGAKLIDSRGQTQTIKKAKLRGIESQGMCCSKKEIGLSDTSIQKENLLELPETTPLGEDIATLFDNVSLELSLTPNLGHCASLLGLAREICHVTQADLVIPQQFSFDPLSTTPMPLHSDPSVCPMFCYAVISGLFLRPSPQELQEALLALKQKPINAIVDITNYIMLCLGQPVHAYDARKVVLDSLGVQKLPSPQSYTLLNGETVLIPSGATVVCDAHRILALGGVMGGQETSITESTTTIVLEAAYFLPTAIRASQKLLLIHSEAAYRFSRGVDPQNVLPAFYAAIHFTLSLFPEAQVSSIYKIGDIVEKPREISFHTTTIQRILGQTLSSERLVQKLETLGFSVVPTPQNNVVSVKVPSYRHDINEEIDLVEEIYRTEPWHLKNVKPVSCFTPIYALKRQIANRLANSGLQEFFTCDLLDPELATWHREECQALALQGSKHATVLRNSLLPGLLKSAATNLHRQVSSVQAFEIGTLYSKHGSQYQETQSLGILLTGDVAPLSWIAPRSSLSFYSLKGRVETLFQQLYISLDCYTIKSSHHPDFHPYQQAAFCLNEHIFGSIGRVHPHLTQKAQIKHPVFFAEISLDFLCKLQKKITKIYKPCSIYPSSFRDVTLTVPEEMPADALRRKLLSKASKWLESVSIISIYQDKGPVAKEKNVTLRLVFQDYERTLSHQDIEEEYCRLVALLTELLTDTRGTADR
ncbi:phenylalanine--tRNA ligase subunit beta [Candidatus Chlamydia sanziniae]|uniref:Phenylalanine--tRNA ligase beta subunit n=1 Tax=Candidatus Chlamydia sanziniae TaxID=1806891 RepID=A0A1A9HWH3_9CHLA|nr:phenylalanine--tRNA ligase subunit beta [Candidatus Chlamydia sanziniae]ANH78394.1 Phenylalanyl-tRNA synthetase beta chain [Candidatus Chlamydia sanziniae]